MRLTPEEIDIFITEPAGPSRRHMVAVALTAAYQELDRKDEALRKIGDFYLECCCSNDSVCHNCKVKNSIDQALEEKPC